MIRQHINKFKNTLHLWKRFLTWDRRQCIWAQTLGKLNELLLACLTCPCANVFCVFMCSRASVPTCLACLYASRANVSCVFTCPSINVLCVLTCSRANVPCVLTCQRALRVFRAYMPTCSHFCNCSFFLLTVK